MNLAIIDSLGAFLSHHEAMLEGTDIQWGEYLDYYYLICKKQTMGDKSFCNNQVKDYNRGAKHDDAPDSLYGTVQLTQCVQRLRYFELGL